MIVEEPSPLVIVVWERVSAGQEKKFNPPVMLERFDPEYADGHGYAWMTRDLRKAQRFATFLDALGLYQTVSKLRPRRADGQPNRPLMSFTIEVVTVDKAVELGAVEAG